MNTHRIIKREIFIEGHRFFFEYAEFYGDRLQFIHPFLYIYEHTNIKQIQDPVFREYCINHLQVLFHVILRKYLKIEDGEFTHVLNINVIQFLYIYQTLSAKKETVDFNIFLNLDPEEIIVRLFSFLSRLLPSTGNIVGHERVTARLLPDGEINKGLKIMQKVGKLISLTRPTAVRSVIVHGSYSTNDYVREWSDLDVLIILKSEIFVNRAVLRQAKELLSTLSLSVYMIDPTAHHEFMYITELDMMYYPQSFFPVNLFAYSTVVFGDRHLSFNLRDDYVEKIQSIVNINQYFQNKVASQDYSTNLSSWKNDLSQILLWPTLMLEAIGVYVYKRNSFQKFPPYFPCLPVDVVNEASEKRRQWRSRNYTRYYPLCVLRIFSRKMNFRFIRFLNSFSERELTDKEKKDVEIITKKALLLAKEGTKIILNKSNDD